MKLIGLFLIAVGASAQITITELGPAASYIPTGLPGGGIAQGSYFYIKGTNLGPAATALFSGPVNYQIGVDLAGTRVRVTVGSTTVDAFPYFTSPTQVNVILPSSTPVGVQGTVTVLYNGAQATFPIVVVRAAYGIFTLNSAGSGPAVVTNGVTNQVVTFTNVLHPGDTGVLWGTGLGAAVGFPDNQPAQFFDLKAGVTMFIGGKAAAIAYAGRTPGLSGLDQVNFVVPDGVSGCGVPLVVRVGSVASNFTTIPVAASGSTCSDPGGLTAADLAAAQAGGLAVGEISLSRVLIKVSAGNQSFESASDEATGSFLRYDFNSFIRSTDIVNPPVGSCTVSLYRGRLRPSDPVQTVQLDAGAKLTFSGPGGAKDMVKANGLYTLAGEGQVISGVPGGVPGTTFLDPGTYTVTGTGGANVGPFSSSVTVPAALVWTNQPAITSVPRNTDLRVTWSGGGASDQALIFGGSFDSASSTTGSFLCLENVSAGGFTIPSYVLSTLPGSSTGILAVGSFSPGNRFTATGINFGTISYSVLNLSNVSYQ